MPSEANQSSTTFEIHGQMADFIHSNKFCIVLRTMDLNRDRIHEMLE